MHWEPPFKQKHYAFVFVLTVRTRPASYFRTHTYILNICNLLFALKGS